MSEGEKVSEVESCPTCPEGWRVIGSSCCSECAKGWHPIETAPKDGTSILLTDARVLGWTHVAGWDEYQFRGETRWGWGRDDCDTYWHPDMFTHWMPLPAPPKA